MTTQKYYYGKKEKKLGVSDLTLSKAQRFSNASRKACIGIFSLFICQ